MVSKRWQNLLKVFIPCKILFPGDTVIYDVPSFFPKDLLVKISWDILRFSTLETFWTSFVYLTEIFLFGHGLQMPLLVVSLKICFYHMSSFQMPKASLDIPHPTNKFGPLIPCRLWNQTLEAVPLATSCGTSAQIMAYIGWGEQGKVGHALGNPGLCKSIRCF